MMPRASALAFVLLATHALAGCATGEDDSSWDQVSLEVTADDATDDAAFDHASADGKADGALTYRAVAQLVVNAGVPCSGDRVALATAIARAESSFRASITNVVGNSAGTDRGLWQINSYWHPEVSKACALSASCNARAAARISTWGRYWTQWWTYKNGKHLPYMAQAKAAQDIVCADE